jgi:hypothetical protein
MKNGPSMPLPVDTATFLKYLKARYPGVSSWFGKSTRHYWALVDNMLVEAETQEQLISKINDALWMSRRPVRRANAGPGDR